jgi:hypothetical protein
LNKPRLHINRSTFPSNASWDLVQWSTHSSPSFLSLPWLLPTRSSRGLPLAARHAILSHLLTHNATLPLLA